MSDVIRYGIIGTGMMGCEHILTVQLCPGAQVTAIADPDDGSRRWGRDLMGEGTLVFDNYRELLKSAPIDAVVVATPNFTHHDVLQDVFRTDKHVLVEKPLCTTVADCHRVVDAAARHRGVVWVGMEYRYMRAVGLKGGPQSRWTTDHGPRTTDQGPGTRDQGPGTRDQGQQRPQTTDRQTTERRAETAEEHGRDSSDRIRVAVP